MRVRVGGHGIALAAAFFLGLAVGMAGLSKHQDRAAARAERDDISIIAVFAGVSESVQDFLYDIDLYNNGSRPVEIGVARLVESGNAVVPVGSYPAGVGRRLNPENWLTLGRVHGSPMCPDKPAAGDPVLAVDVITSGGDLRSVQLPVLDRDGWFAAARSEGCNAVRHPESAIAAYHDETVLGPDETPTATVVIDNPAGRSVEIVAIASAGDVELETVEALPVTIPPQAARTLELRIVNSSCQAAARGADLTLTAESESARANHHVRLNPWLVPPFMDYPCDGRA